MIIAIPSRGRAKRLLETGTHTLAAISLSCKSKTILFVPPEEAHEYHKVGERWQVNVESCSWNRVDKYSMAEIRDYIILFAKANRHDFVFMLDDDLRLYFKPDRNTYVKMNEGPFFDMMIHDMLYYCGIEYPVVGITARQFSQDKFDKVEINTRVIQAMMLHVSTIIKEDLKFVWEAPCMSDYNFLITLLQRGYKNICLNTYCRNDVPQTEGGCSLQRTPEMQSESAMALHHKFPDIVSPYVKTGAYKQAHVNVKIAWRKAYVPK